MMVLILEMLLTLNKNKDAELVTRVEIEVRRQSQG
jgi:hypothetical protein